MAQQQVRLSETSSDQLEALRNKRRKNKPHIKHSFTAVIADLIDRAHDKECK